MKKYLTKFSTRADYTAALENLDFPNVTYLSEDDEMVFAQNAPESPYEMRFFTLDPEEPIDTDRFQFEIDIVYCLKLYDKDNEDYVAITDWSPEITPTPDGKAEIEEDPKNNQYLFNVRYGSTDPDVNFKAIVDRAVVDEANYHFIAGL